VLDTPNPPLAVAADKAYGSQKVRQQIKDEGVLPVIPNRANATKKAYCPKRIYRRRHKIENYFCRIKDWRRIATRYDKFARNFLAAAGLKLNSVTMRVERSTSVWALAYTMPKTSSPPAGLTETAARSLRKPPSQLSTCGW
jgi:transposase